MEMQSSQPNLHRPIPYLPGERNLSTSSYHNIFGYLIAALIGIVGANVQSSTKPLLETHSTNIWSFLIATTIYCGAYSADMKSRHHRENSTQFWGLAAVVSGSVSALSLVSTLVTLHNIGHIILYTSWICSAISILVYQYGTLFMDACRQLHNQILKPIFSDICSWFQASDTSSTEQQQLPPV